MAEAVLGLVGGDASLRMDLFDLLPHVWQVVGVDVLEHVHLANDLLWVVAEQPPEGGTCVPQSAVWVDYRDDFRGILYDREQPPIILGPMRMRRSISVTRGIVTEVVSVSIRGVHISLSGGKSPATPWYSL